MPVPGHNKSANRVSPAAMNGTTNGVHTNGQSKAKRPDPVGTNRTSPVDMPVNLKPYVFHGVDVDWSKLTGKEVIATCPFCGKPRFYIECETGLWSCKVCGGGAEKGGGNAYTFLRSLWTQSHALTTEEDYVELAQSRGLLDPTTLERWGVCKSLLTGHWLVPGFSITGEICQLYSYRKSKDSPDKRLLYATPTLSHYLHHKTARGDDSSKETIFLCEGPWDGMALWETLQGTALENTAAVIAMPGVMGFNEKFCPLFEDKEVIILCDSDHPKPHPKGVGLLEPAGYAGAKRTAQLLAGSDTPALTIKYLSWGPSGFDQDRKSGYDIRDFLMDASPDDATIRYDQFTELVANRVVPVPPEWIPGRSDEAAATGGTEIKCLPCDTYAEVEAAWEDALKWTPDLNKTLLCMLSSIISIKALGDQLWFRIMGPPSCGKSTLAEAVSVARQYVKPVSSIRGFHSGYKSDSDGDEDNSLIAKCYNKTVVIKDGDTLLQSPNYRQILSEARDIYDRVSRVEYRNDIARDYESLNMTILLLGTSSLRTMDTSELGERFLNCVIAPLPEDIEDEILMKIADNTEAGMAMESTGEAEKQYSPILLKAMQLTGGYVKYLRENSRTLLEKIKLPQHYKIKLVKFGKFIAYMRARPSDKQLEVAEREVAGRLVGQILRLGMCLTAVLNKEVVDDEIMERVRDIVMDTAAGRSLNVLTHLYKQGSKGEYEKVLAMITNETKKEEHKLLLFMNKIGIVESFKPATNTGTIKWRLTAKLRELYEEITK